MMYHHDSRDYAFAVTEAAKAMRDKLHKDIEHAKSHSMDAIQRVFAELPDDKIVRAKGVEFANDGDKFMMAVKAADGQIIEDRVHPWALGQIAEYSRVPKTFLNALQGMRVDDDCWGAKLAARNLNDIFHHMPVDERRLIRSVDTEARGFLSTK